MVRSAAAQRLPALSTAMAFGPQPPSNLTGADSFLIKVKKQKRYLWIVKTGDANGLRIFKHGHSGTSWGFT